jgi:putative ABC transport system permease protein
MKAHVPQLLGLILLLTVGVCFFITLFTIVIRYEETAEQFFSDNSYADVTFYGNFSRGQVDFLSRETEYAAGRIVRDFRVDDLIFRAVSITHGVNVPFLYEGRFPANANEGIILRRNAIAMQIETGDTITLGDSEITITGLAASTEYIYMVQNERNMMAQQNRFGVVFVMREFFADEFYNEIVVLLNENADVNELAETVGAFRTIRRGDQTNYILYRNDLEEIRSFAYIFPFIFAVLIAVVIYVMLTRTIQKDRKQIGVMKAMGANDSRIISIYLSQFCVTAALGAALGCFAAMVATDTIVSIMSSMFEVPALSFAFYPALWVGAIVFCVLLCAVSGAIALAKILPLMPALALRPRTPKGGRRIFLEKITSVWARLSFNTRYALKNSLRNKSRFFAVVLGMTGSCALLVFSLGFYNSISKTQNVFFENFANYDVIVTFHPMSMQIEHPAAPHISENARALVIHVDINDEHHTLAIVENGFDMVNIPAESLREGVIIPEYFAQIWGVRTGDFLEVEDNLAVVSAITPQHLGLTLYTSFEYIEEITGEFPPVYNTLYGRTECLPTLTDFLSLNMYDFATIYDDKTSFDSIMESMEVLIWFMIGCSVILGFTVLYAVGLINLSAREYEYMFMGVMGCSHKSIIAAHAKETILQLALALPLGFLCGRLLLEAIKGEFSGANFVIYAHIETLSFIISATVVIAVTVVMALVTSRHIEKLDIVEGLKAQDDC